MYIPLFSFTHKKECHPDRGHSFVLYSFIQSLNYNTLTPFSE